MIVPVAATAPPPPPARVLVMADEWSLVPSRTVLVAGAAIVQLANVGEDDHDVLLRRLDAAGKPTGPATRIGPLHPDARGEARLRLRTGRYRLVCTLGDHASRGMRTTLRVRAR